MSVVNFTIPKPLAQRIAEAIRLQGFASKAEFFRFAAMSALQLLRLPTAPIKEDYTVTAQRLSEKMYNKFHGKKLPSLEEQFADLR